MVQAVPLGMETTKTRSGFLPRLQKQIMEGDKTIMTRVKLSIRLGVVGGIIWGLLFTAYYTMLPYITIPQDKRFLFAVESASLCFTIMIIVILALPYLYKALKEAKYKNED